MLVLTQVSRVTSMLTPNREIANVYVNSFVMSPSCSVSCFIFQHVFVLLSVSLVLLPASFHFHIDIHHLCLLVLFWIVLLHYSSQKVHAIVFCCILLFFFFLVFFFTITCSCFTSCVFVVPRGTPCYTNYNYKRKPFPAS